MSNIITLLLYIFSCVNYAFICWTYSSLIKIISLLISERNLICSTHPRLLKLAHTSHCLSRVRIKPYSTYDINFTHPYKCRRFSAMIIRINWFIELCDCLPILPQTICKWRMLEYISDANAFMRKRRLLPYICC